MGIVEEEEAGTGLADDEVATSGGYEGGVAEANMLAGMDMDKSMLDQDDDAFLDDEEEAARLLEMSFDLMLLQAPVVPAVPKVPEAPVVPVAVGVPAGKVACKYCLKPLTRSYMSQHLRKCKRRPRSP